MNGDGSSLNDWLGGVSQLGGTAAGILNALNNKPSNTPAPAPVQSSKTPWGMIAAIGGGVVLLLVVLMAFGGRR